ncbi:methyltransferase domain-containing protein [Plakobranchus ocellatus]|uniref:Methyltransferase domain-containing protein n=1 Tax=Plakobranchus ocellatus TaxID=259542 RepID=A0AAV3ZHP0_9GAST|nr:methyltransferase domain-containing protein [Plakobranchus ocellatus]
MSSFSERLGQVVNNTVIGLAVSLAREHGIFQVLADSTEPLTSQQVANRRSLKERYVREILNSLATAELVEVKVDATAPGVLVYSLESGAKDVMDSYLGAFVGIPALMARRYASVTACVPENGPRGVRYTAHAEAAFSALSYYTAPKFVDAFLHCVPGLKDKLELGIDVLEIGSGYARMSAILASKFPKSRFTASEVIPWLVEANRERWGDIPNLHYRVLDACDIPESPDESYDWILCSDVIHDLPEPLKALQGTKRLLRKPDGLFTFVDMSSSGSPLVDRGKMLVAALYSASAFLCVPDSYQGDKESHALGACWGRQAAIDLGTQAGFSVTDSDIDDMHVLYVCRP